MSHTNDNMLSFKERADSALHDARLRTAIERTTSTARAKRQAAISTWPNFSNARALGQRIKDHVIVNLDHYLLTFEQNAVASGAKVHWAETAEEACKIVVDICLTAGAKTVTRSKSMLGEEIGLPAALEAAGLDRIETDLAEHIVQLAGDRPSHIIWPALHRTQEEVAELFRLHHRTPRNSNDIPSLVASARQELRESFLKADVGISGANFLVAESGAVCTVTNEGNAELTTTIPRVHIVTAGIEKLVPTLRLTMVLLRLLVRSATGADFTQYTTFHSGSKRAGDPDGPEEFHIVLVDNGRSRMLGADLEPMLRCLRCGACMNHCVVFRQIGGHAYGGTYPGPMGSVLTPVLDGLEKSRDLAHACTLNGSCQDVCPVNIPLPTLLRGWREKSWKEGLEPTTMRHWLGLWAFFAGHPFLYRLATAISVRIMRFYAKSGWIKSMPLMEAWILHRDFPKPARRTFMEEYKRVRF